MLIIVKCAFLAVFWINQSASKRYYLKRYTFLPGILKYFLAKILSFAILEIITAENDYSDCLVNEEKVTWAEQQELCASYRIKIHEKNSLMAMILFTIIVSVILQTFDFYNIIQMLNWIYWKIIVKLISCAVHAKKHRKIKIYMNWIFSKVNENRPIWDVNNFHKYLTYYL